jgi:hypothetical protein
VQIFFDLLNVGRVLPLGLFKRPSCLCNRLLAAFPLLLPRGFSRQHLMISAMRRFPRPNGF